MTTYSKLAIREGRPDPYPLPAPAYRITWVCGFGAGDGATEEHARAWFDMENGFGPHEQGLINQLPIGMEMAVGNGQGMVSIIRIK